MEWLFFTRDAMAVAAATHPTDEQAGKPQRCFMSGDWVAVGLAGGDVTDELAALLVQLWSLVFDRRWVRNEEGAETIRECNFIYKILFKST